eukprot:g4928.t1
MYSAELVNHCNMALWLGNSRVVHSVSHDGPLGPYRRADVVLPVWAHEPNVVRAPTGEWVMYASMLPGGRTANVAGRPCVCSPATGQPISSSSSSPSSSSSSSCTGDRDWSVPLQTYMLFASSPNGPWSKPQLVKQEAPLIDSNFAPVIRKDGSLLGIFRDDGNDTSTRQNLHLVHATNWRDLRSYREEIVHISGGAGGGDDYSENGEGSGGGDSIFDGPEDPFVWVDGDGHFHALFHQYPHAAGPHAFSLDGRVWHWAPAKQDGVAVGAPGTTPGTCAGSPTGNVSCAYGPMVELGGDAGGVVTLGSRERPHLVFAADGVTELALSNGACPMSEDHGMCFTMVQPLATAAAMATGTAGFRGAPKKASSPTPYPSVPDAAGVPGHDPSALQRTDDGYYVTLVTGSGGGDAFGMRYLDPANYSAGWHKGPYSYLNPVWVRDYLYPDGCGGDNTNTNDDDSDKMACPFWAPDLVTSGNGIEAGGNDMILYYSVAVPNDYGKACIGRATGTFSSSPAPHIDWKDAGVPVFCSNVSQVHAGGGHAIDPSVSVDS